MKKNFIICFLSFAGLIFTSSCSKDDSVSENRNKEKLKISNYLNAFYQQNYKLGNSIKTVEEDLQSVDKNYRTIEFEKYTITEVFVENETKARGYIITDINNEEFLYFFDVNRTDFKLTSYDVKANAHELIDQINLSEEYLISDEYNFIKVILDGNIDGGQNNSTFRVRYTYGACRDGFRGVYQASYFLGIRVSKISPVYNDNGSPVTVGCNETFTPN